MNKNLRILILEDSASDADLIEFELMEAGFAFTPRRAINEKQFLCALEEFPPDLILSDYDLPQYNGAMTLAGGASDCVLKDHLDRLVPAVHEVIKMRSET